MNKIFIDWLIGSIWYSCGSPGLDTLSVLSSLLQCDDKGFKLDIPVGQCLTYFLQVIKDLRQFQACPKFIYTRLLGYYVQISLLGLAVPWKGATHMIIVFIIHASYTSIVCDTSVHIR